MMQRLLRGRALYVGLGVLILVLYWRALQQGPAGSPPTVESRPIVHAQPWWPEQLDIAQLRQRIAQVPRLALAWGLLTLFLTGMLLGGVGLTLWGLWTGRVRTIARLSPGRLPRWSFGELGRIMLLTLLIAALMPFVRIALVSYQPYWGLDLHVWLVGSMLFLDLFVILLILTFAASKRRGQSAWRALGFSRHKLAASLETGFRGYLAVFPWLFLLLFAIMEIARALGIEPPMEPLHELIFEEQRPVVLGLTALLACVIGPAAEELLFRGVLYTALRQRIPRVAAVLVSGAVFALIHTNPIGFFPIMLLGSLLAYLYERTGSLASPLAIHILHNAFLLVLAMAFREVLALG